MENNNYNGSEIAIVGLAARVPGADNIETFYGNLKNAKESITRFSDEELIASGINPENIKNPSYVKSRGVLNDADMFDASFFGYSPKEAKFMDPQQRVLLECAWTAIEDSGYNPQNSPGPVGVFVGGSQNTYFFKNLLPYLGVEGIDKAGVSMIHSGTDLLATTLSYKLNLQGPSLTIQTACSTSLVAVHQAVMSLLSGECNMALAGGVSITPPFVEGYEYMQGGIKSADGHCRTFDEKANGTLPGNGVGLVVLKRLDDALKDGDQIYSIIRGSAVNNDGSAKIGYTAPSIDGQVKVIQDALNISGVDPSTITYVEAHGTGTSIGDPIEVRALTQAYRSYTDKTGYCAIGSVKTNIGHLDAAAGIIGLIKTVCALQDKTVPPSLHFEKGNTKIPFEETPFYVASKLQPWHSTDGPRRAGVSSFGIGGTNAHVIVEEPPIRKALPSKKRSLVIPISAKSPQALKMKVNELTTHLDQNDLPLADVAYTLQTGRQAFEFRLAIMTDSIKGLKHALRQSKVGQVHVRKNQEPVFLFPGQGSQYVDMGKELYEHEPSFRATIDQCADLLLPLLQLDIRNIMYPIEADRKKAEAQIRETSITQPVLFTIEYSLAQWWLKQGVAPHTFIGHSVGEYVAACLAGVFELEDALRLVAARGKMMHDVERGSMLAVPLPLTEIHELLKKHPLSLAAVNAPSMNVISGQTDAIMTLKLELEDQGVQVRLLHTSHAFHSSMVEPVLEQFAAIVANTPRQVPTKLWISNITGTWITAEEAVNPQYWAQHIRETVDFEKGIQTLLQEGAQFFLEVGPGDTLSTFIRQTAKDQGANPIIFSSIQAISRKKLTDDSFLQETLCRLWQEGGLIDWHTVWSDEKGLRVALPSYPFERHRHWVDAKPNRIQYKDVISKEDETEINLVEEKVNTRPHLLSEYEAPQTIEEKELVEIWEDLTGVHPIGINDNFFEIGGHSLLGIQMVAKIRDRFKTEISVDTMSAAPTLAELLSIIQESEQKVEITKLPSIGIDTENLYEPFPLTVLAQGYLVGRSNAFELGDIGSHFYYEVESNQLDLKRLERSFQQVIDRHEMMRAIVQEDGQQRILKDLPPYEILSLDLSGLSQDDQKEQLHQLRTRMVREIPPADCWPMYDIRAVQLQESMTRIMMRFDYLIMDALTFQVISRDWQAFYEGWEDELPELGTTYRDYIVALKEIEQGPLYERAKKYWFDRIETLPAAPKLPTIHTTTTKPALIGRRGMLEPKYWRALQKRAATANLSASGILLAAYAEVLSKWSSSKDFTINLPTFNRIDLHKHVHDLVGSFTSTTLVEVLNSKPRSFEERAKQLQHQLLQDLDHRLIGGVQVLRERKRRQTTDGTAEIMPFVFTGFVNVESKEKKLELLEWIGPMVYRDNQTPQCLLDNQVSMEGENLIYNWDSLDSVFPEGLIQSMFDAYGELLEKLATDETAWQSQDPVELTADQQKRQEDANATEQDFPSGLLHELVFEQARLYPESIAISAPELQLTYKELTSRSMKIGQNLRAMNTKPNQLVAVLMEKGWEQGVGILSVIAAGSAYLPIDPYLPIERIQQLLNEGNVKVILTQQHLSQFVQENFANYEILLVTTEEEVEIGVSSLPPVQSLDDLAYVIFTSGSTGRPKGVMIDHRAIVNTLQDINKRFNIQYHDRVLALSNLNFDLSVYDFFGTWLVGGTVIVPNSEMERDPSYLLDLLVAEQVTVWNSVPALLEMIVSHSESSGVPSPLVLRLIMMSGDWIPLSLPDRIRKIAPKTEVISLGGATEAAIWSIYYPINEVNPQWNSIPYGRPLANQTMHILDPVTGTSCPDWVPGDLYIGGMGLAQGYWQDPERTAQSFVTINGQSMYRTGDIALRTPNGQIEFLGRSDFQVKIRGFRIELGEIETVLRNHKDVHEAIVVAREDQPGRKRLVGYVIAEQTLAIETELISTVKQKLPDYMVPQRILVLERLPITTNGKIDRKALPVPEIDFEIRNADSRAPYTDTEKKLEKIWKEILQVENVAAYDHFFEQGGDSLLATRMLTLVRETFNVRYSLRQIFEEPMLASMAAAIDSLCEEELQKEQEKAEYVEMMKDLTEEEIDALLLQLGGKTL